MDNWIPMHQPLLLRNGECTQQTHNKAACSQVCHVRPFLEGGAGPDAVII
jgi:hypothetical protein